MWVAFETHLLKVLLIGAIDWSYCLHNVTPYATMTLIELMADENALMAIIAEEGTTEGSRTKYLKMLRKEIETRLK